MTPRPVGLAAARRHSLLVTDDGHVLAAGPAGASECAVADWTDVVGVAAGNVHTAKNTSRSHSVGLCSDSTVLATGWNAHGQCGVGAWTDIVTVAAGWRRIPGVRAKGTVVATGRRAEGACGGELVSDPGGLRWGLALRGSAGRRHRRGGRVEHARTVGGRGLGRRRCRLRRQPVHRGTHQERLRPGIGKPRRRSH